MSNIKLTVIKAYKNNEFKGYITDVNHNVMIFNDEDTASSFLSNKPTGEKWILEEFKE
jgi:hypothetical protein